MRSFDFYDTLVTRLVATPADIFSLVSDRLRLPAFRSMRIAAEIKARKTLGGEVTFQNIYDFMALPLDLKEQARSLELDFERSLVVSVSAVSSQFRSGDLIVSDMYHDDVLYRDVLDRLMPGMVPGAVLISGMAGLSKETGALWKKVAMNYPSHESHIGDNMFADVRQARRRGLVATQFEGAMLNRYEITMQKKGGDGSMIAGASRAARLSLTRRDTSRTEAATIEVFASVFGPLILAFAQWIMRSCEQEGIQDVYFLARDGQLPFRMCSSLAAEKGQTLRCHYIFASRQALHLPGCETINDAESWLLENTPCLTLGIIADRACVPLDVVVAAAAPYSDLGPQDNIPPQDRGILACVIRAPSFVEAFMNRVDSAFKPASAYYRTQGFATGRAIALVDVGWNGRLQSSLASLLQKSGCRPPRILGLYLSLSRRLGKAPQDDLRGFLADPERARLASLFDEYRPVCEAALSADHPTTLRFELSAGVAHPVFGEPYPAQAQQRIALQHATINAFVDNVIALGRAAGRSIVCPNALVAENFETFLSRPTLADGLAFEGFSHTSGQTGTDAQAIARTVRLRDLLERPRNLGYWTEGTLSASGLGAIALVRRFARRLRSRWLPA